jgi:hypothetical protein
MELQVFKFDCYPNAINWLNENSGVAVHSEDTPPACLGGRISLHLLFSNLMGQGDILQILEFFPKAQNVNKIRQELGYPPLEYPHSNYLIHGYTRNEIVEILKKNFGAIAVKSPCCMESVSTEEAFSRLKELEIRLGGTPLSQQDPTKIGDLYRKLY